MAQPTYDDAVGYVGENFFTMEFDVALSAANPPPANAFDVQVNGTGVSVVGVNVDSIAKTVSLTLGAVTFTAGDVIDFSYSDPTDDNDANAIQGTDGADLATFGSFTTVSGVRPGPSAPPTPAVSSGSDSGALGDGITSDMTPTLTGTAAANATIKLYDTDGTTQLGTTTADGSGNWSLTSTTLSDGSHSLKVRQTDGDGITSPLSTGLALTVDTAAAAPTSLQLSSGSDSGRSGDGITNVGMPVVTGHAEANATVRLYDTGGTTQIGTATANGSGNWSIASSALTEGVHTLTAKQTDLAGNVSGASDQFEYTLDTIGATGMALSTTSVLMSSATNGATVATLSATDATAIVYGFAAGNGTIDADNAKFTISGTSLVAAQSLTAGTYHIYLNATDASGNDSFQIFAIDVVDAPSVTSIERASGASATVPTAATSIEYTVTFSQAVTGVDVNDFALTKTGNAGGTIASVAGSGDTYTVTVSGVSGDGALRLDLKNSGTGIVNGSNINIVGGYAAGDSFALDHTAAAAPSVPVMTSGTDTGVSDSDGVTSNGTPVFTGTSEANATVKLYGSDGTTVLGTATADGAGIWSITSSTLAEGQHELTVKQTDAAGNVSAASSVIEVRIDRSGPVLDSAVVTGDTLVLSYSDGGSLDAANMVANGAFSVMVGGQAVAVTTVTTDALAGTITLTLATAATPGETVTLSYTDPTGGDDANAVQDLDGNDAASLTDYAVSNPVVAPPITPPAGTIVDGVQVETGTVHNGDGTTSQVINIPVVSDGRQDQVGGNDAADIPLVTDAAGNSLLAAQLPAGFGLTVTGSGAPQTAGTSLADLIREIKGVTETGSDAQLELTGGGSGFLSALPTDTPLLVETFKLVVPGGVAPDGPLVITGSAADGAPKSAVVIDARGLPAGTAIELHNVDFAAVIGYVQVTLGEGSQMVFGDDGAQVFVLGAGDDFVAGGGGNDTASYADTFAGVQVSLNDAGQFIVIGAEGTDTIETIEQIEFTDGHVAYGGVEMDDLAGQAYRLYQSAFGRFADSDGLDYWISELAAGRGDIAWVAKSFMLSEEFKTAYGAPDSLSDADLLSQLYTNILGRAPDAEGFSYWMDQLSHGFARENLVASFAESVENVANIGLSDTQPLWYL